MSDVSTNASKGVPQASEHVACRLLREEGDNMFSKRMTLVSQWQDMAENFYVERADFTYQRTIGTQFAGNLTTSYPLQVRRDLAGVLSSMLRPADKDWFYMRATRQEVEDNAAKRWLERAALIMRRAMYDRKSQFMRATKEADNDFVTFGQAVITVELNVNRDTLLFRCWHLRDVCWQENAEGVIDRIHRNWKPQLRDVVNLFGSGRKGTSVHPKVVEELAKTPLKEILCRHIVVPYDDYKPKDVSKLVSKEAKKRPKFWSIYLDVVNDFVMEEVGININPYVIPRWQTVSGSQYAFSPCTVSCLPDGRLMQQMTLTLLEASEKASNPPILATEEAIRSDMALYAGGVTWLDPEYDEKLGAALRPLDLDYKGLPVGFQLLEQVKMQMVNAFYLNKIGLPPVSTQMTALEASQRVSEYIRNALPVFEPMESEYNGALCETVFDLLLENNAFGPAVQVPPSLRGEDLQFRFVGPLAEAKDMQKGQTFLQAKAVVAEAGGLDPSSTAVFDVQAALEDVLDGSVPATWVRPPEQVKQIQTNAAAQQQQQAMAEQLAQGGLAAKQIGDGAQSLSAAAASAGGTPAI